MWKTLAVFCQLNNPKLPSIQSPKYSIKNRWRRLGKSSEPPRHLHQFGAMIASVSPPRFAILHGTYTIQKYTSSSAHQTSFMKREICSLAHRPPPLLPPAVTCCGGGEKTATMSIIKGKTRGSKLKY